MKNTLRKIVISTLIAVSAATATIAPAATIVMANVYDIETCYTADGDMFFHNTETGIYYYADGSGIHYCNENGVLKSAQNIQSAQKSSSSLDKSQADQTRYANVSDFLALRTGPSTDNEMIAKLAPNAQVTIIGQTGNWVKVYAPSVDRDGYVSVNYLTKTKKLKASLPPIRLLTAMQHTRRSSAQRTIWHSEQLQSMTTRTRSQSSMTATRSRSLSSTMVLT